MINFRKNASLILGISIPILMIVLIAASIYLPGLFIKPKFNFLYLSGEFRYDYNNQPLYIIENEKLIKNKITYYEDTYRYYTPPKYDAKFYIYDVTTNESKQVSFEEAQKLTLDSNKKSPDGFEVVYGSRGDGFFPFFYGSETDYETRYLKGNNVSKKLNIQLSRTYSFYNNFNFIGWIK